MEKILVTGAAGFIGFHLSKRLLSAGYNVSGIDNLNDYYDPKLKQDRLTILKEDEIAIKFGEYLYSEKGKSILKKHGFSLPNE